MRIHLTALLLLGWALGVQAQEKDKKLPSYFSVSIGAGIPGSELGKKSLQEPSGFASTGVSAGIGYYQWLGAAIGFVMQAQYQVNPVDGTAMEKELSKSVFNNTLVVWSGGGQVPDVPGNTYQGWKVAGASWKALSFLPGVFSEMPLDEKGKTIFSSVIAVGAIRLAAPALNATIQTDTLQAALTQTGKAAWGFSYRVSSGVKFTLAKKLHLLLNLAYQGSANVNFKGIITKLQVLKGQTGQPGYQASLIQNTADYKQRYNVINTEAALLIDL